VLRKEDNNDWVKKCMEYEEEGASKENLERDCEKRLSGMWIEKGGCHGPYLMDEADNG